MRAQSWAVLLSKAHLAQILVWDTYKKTFTFHFESSMQNKHYLSVEIFGREPWTVFSCALCITGRETHSFSPFCLIIVFRSLNHIRLFAAPWTAAHQASLAFTQNLLKFLSVELVILSIPLILCNLLLFPCIFPNIRLFSSESALCIRWPKYWSFSFSISPSNNNS